jgi:dipeptidyl aminopeptidase/acylaminoacyl peptidase
MSTSFDFDRELTAWLDAAAPTRAPDGVLNAALQRTSRMRPHRRLALAERWQPMQLTMQRPTFPRTALYLAAVLGLALLLALSMFLVAGSLHRLPAPFGLAKPGLIAYAVSGDIYARSLDSSLPIQLTSGDTFDVSATYSPDGTTIAFWSGPSSAATDAAVPASLVLTNADGSGRRVLVSDPGVQVWEPAPEWSPDSKYVAFSRPAGTTQEIAVIAVQTGELASVIPSGVEPSWSPDGTQIAYTAVAETLASGIWVANRDGTNAHRVSDALTSIGPSTNITGGWIDTSSISGPRWSPDGSQVAFAGGFFNRRLFVVGADGSNLRELTVGPGGASDPVWSPTGTRIAFVRNTVPTITDATAPLNVSFINADGSNLVDLEHKPVGYRLIWAPDESRVLAVATAEGHGETVLALDPGGTAAAVEIAVPGNWGSASWQRLAP